MDERVRRLATYASAGLLSLLTIGVFATQVQGGPESTVRKFHEAVAERDMQALQRTLTPESNPGPANLLIQRAGVLFAYKGKYEILRTNSRGAIAQVDVQYSVPNNPTQDTLWILVQTRQGWRIDANSTVAAMRAALGFGSPAF